MAFVRDEGPGDHQQLAKGRVGGRRKGNRPELLDNITSTKTVRPGMGSGGRGVLPSTEYRVRSTEYGVKSKVCTE